MFDALRQKRALRIGVALFLAGQIFSVAHASEYGFGEHEHNGIVCLAILSDEPEGLTSSGELSLPSFVTIVQESMPLRLDTDVSDTSNARPPATGPPSI